MSTALNKTMTEDGRTALARPPAEIPASAKEAPAPRRGAPGLRRRIEGLFWKTRIVYAREREGFGRAGTAADGSCLVVRGDSAGPAERERARRLLASYFPASTLAARLAEAECTVFLALDAKGELEGYGWIRHATRRPIWYDAFEIPRRAALFFNGYVLEGARRRGVYSRLLAAVFRELAARPDCERLFLIVEKSNEPALRHGAKLGLYRAYTNGLVTWFGKNVLSVYAGRRGTRAHGVSRNATRARL